MRYLQPDRRSCGAAALIMARRLQRPDYAARVGDQDTFAREVTTLHRRITSVVDTSGGLQMPWLRAIGTPPWAVSRELRILTGATYGMHSTRRPGETWRFVQYATRSHPVVVYVGDRWAPRHVVLAVERVADAVRTYEPAAGHALPVSRGRWEPGALNLAGWDRPWLVCAPTR